MARPKLHLVTDGDKWRAGLVAVNIMAFPCQGEPPFQQRRGASKPGRPHVEISPVCVTGLGQTVCVPCSGGATRSCALRPRSWRTAATRRRKRSRTARWCTRAALPAAAGSDPPEVTGNSSCSPGKQEVGCNPKKAPNPQSAANSRCGGDIPPGAWPNPSGVIASCSHPESIAPLLRSRLRQAQPPPFSPRR